MSWEEWNCIMEQKNGKFSFFFIKMLVLQKNEDCVIEARRHVDMYEKR